MTLKENKVIRQKIHEFLIEFDNQKTGYFSVTNKIGHELVVLAEIMEFEDVDQVVSILEMMYDSRVDQINAEFNKMNVPKKLRFGKFIE